MQDTPYTPCSAIKADGTPCKQSAMYNADTCYMHSPDRKRQNAPKRPAQAEIPRVDLSTPQAQRSALEETIYRARNGLESLSISRLVVYAIATARGTLDDEIVKRLEALEGLQGQ